MKTKIAIVEVSQCSGCPFYDNEYYLYEEFCEKVQRHITFPENQTIPNDCPFRGNQPITDNNELLPTPIRQYVSEREVRFVFASLEARDKFSEGWRQCAKGQGETQHCAQAEELRARNAMLVKTGNTWLATTEAVLRIAGFCDNAEYNYSDPAEFRDKLAAAYIADDIAMKEFIKTLSATPQDADAFITEVRAKALEDAANIAYAWPDDQYAELELRRMASELLNSATQPEGKETGK